MLRVNQPMLQLQVLKLIKSQMPWCGRKWRAGKSTGNDKEDGGWDEDVELKSRRKYEGHYGHLPQLSAGTKG